MIPVYSGWIPLGFTQAMAVYVLVSTCKSCVRPNCGLPPQFKARPTSSSGTHWFKASTVTMLGTVWVSDMPSLWVTVNVTSTGPPTPNTACTRRSEVEERNSG